MKPKDKMNAARLFDGLDEIKLPTAHDLESRVIGAALERPYNVKYQAEGITPGMFSDPTAREAWGAILAMLKEGEDVTLESLARKTGNTSGLTMIAEASMRTVWREGLLKDLCAELRAYALRRAVFEGAVEMAKAATDPRTETSDLTGRPRKLADALEGAAVPEGPFPLADVYNGLCADLETEEVERRQGLKSKAPSGFPTLDRATFGGFGPGNLIILAARPSVGKTAVMCQLAVNAAREGFPAVVYSLEQTNKEIMLRLIFASGKVRQKQVADGAVDWDAMEEAFQEYGGLPLLLDDKASTLEEIADSITENSRRGRCRVAFVDYIGLIRTGNPKDTAYQRVTEITARLKRTAKECGIPIVALCQLNRDPARGNRPPDLHDLRDSGSVEQDADVVMMLSRAGLELDDRNVILFLRKNRQGRANVEIPLEANESFSRFTERGDDPAFNIDKT